MMTVRVVINMKACSLDLISEGIIPFFETFKLKSAKQNDIFKHMFAHG